MEIALWAKVIKIEGKKVLLTPTDVRTGSDGNPYVPAKVIVATLKEKEDQEAFTIKEGTLWLHLPATFRVLCDDVECHGGIGVSAWYTLESTPLSEGISRGKLTVTIKSVALDEPDGETGI